MLRWILAIVVLSCDAAQVPRTFEVNRGQAPSAARFVSGDVLFNERGFWTADHAIRCSFVNSHAAQLAGQRRARYRTEYVDLSKGLKQHVEVENFGEIVYRNIYPGIDLQWHIRDAELEYDFIVRPGADPTQIAMELQADGTVKLQTDGELSVETASGKMRQRLPVVYQDEPTHRIGGGFKLQRNSSGSVLLQFVIGQYDRRRSLTIDPVVSYVSSLNLTAGPTNAISSMAVDASGNVYLAGSEAIPGPTDRCSASQCSSIFLATVNSNGTPIKVQHVITGPSFLPGPIMALDASGAVYLAGSTGASAVPTTADAYQRELKGNNCPAPDSSDGVPCSAGYVMKLDAQGNIVYSTLLGGSGGDRITAIRVDRNGNAWVTGPTRSTDFPATTGAFQKTLKGVQNAFVAALNASGSDLLFASYFGGSGSETPVDIALDSAGAVYLTGSTTSVDLPTTPNPLQSGFGGGTDVYFAKVFNGNIVWAAYWGTAQREVPTGLEIGSDDSLFASVNSTPASGPPVPVTSILKVDAKTSQLLSSFSGVPGVTRFKVDSVGRLVMLGQSGAATTEYSGNAVDACRRIGSPLLARLDRDGKTLLYESNADFGSVLAVDVYGNAYVAGGNGLEKVDFTINPARTISCIQPTGSVIGTAIAPGQIVSLWGAGIGASSPTTASFNSSGSLPFVIDGARVWFNDFMAPILFSGANQVNAIVPFGMVGTNNAKVRIEKAGQTIAEGSVLLASAGSQITNIVNQDGTPNSMNHPAAAGEIVTIYASGGGQTNPPSADGHIISGPAPLILPTAVILFGGSGLDPTSVDVLYSGAAPGTVAGVVQVNIRLPDPLPAPLSPEVPMYNVALSIGHPSTTNATAQLFVK